MDEAIFNKMRDYIDGYLHYAKTASYVALYESFRDHRAIWHTFPDLIWALLPKK